MKANKYGVVISAIYLNIKSYAYKQAMTDTEKTLQKKADENFCEAIGLKDNEIIFIFEHPEYAKRFKISIKELKINSRMVTMQSDIKAVKA